MANGYRVFEVEKSFASGMVVQRVISHLCANNAGEVLTPYHNGDRVAFEVYTHNPLVMSWIEDQLAPFV